jgi:DNA-binding CsgD family transcriptional regulator/tetratricopeptide (TPR) repeat protein
VLRGRALECARLDRLLGAVRAAQSAVLVLRSDAGFGKTALLDYVAERAEGCRVLRAVGVESEMELPFAGLHQLCAPLLDGLDQLPPPQRDALGTAVGLSAGPRPDRFLVGLAVLSLVSDAAEKQPLVLLVDDTQWLDQSSAQVLAFVARRLEADPVGVMFAEREPGLGELAGLPELLLRGLSEADARELLASVISGPLDERVAERIIAETGGNPLALAELPRGLSPAELAGGFGLTASLPLPSRIEESFRRRMKHLPDDSQRLLLLAACEPIGDPALLRRAADGLGIPIGAAAPAEADGLLEVGAWVRFRHPLLRSAVYRTASAEERRTVHRALAGATDPDVDPDRRAWHRAHAAAGPDEEVAEELERSASRARARGGLAAAAAFLERAATLTPDPAHRAARALTAAQTEHDAGAPDAALKLLTFAELGSLDELQRARLERLRAQLAFASRRGSDAPPVLLAAARRLEPLDAELARETYLEALGAAMFAGRLSGEGGMREAAQAARTAPPAPQPPRTIDLLLDGLAARFTDGYGAGLPQLRQALSAICRDDERSEDDVHWLWLACRIAPDVWDDETWNQLARRQMRLARAAGALNVLPLAATYRAGVAVHAAEFDGAAALIDEADAITEATGNAPLMYTSLVLAAWRGRQREALELIEGSLDDAARRGEGRAITLAEYAAAVLHNGLGRYQAALAAAQRACEQDELGLFGWALIELVEAAARSGEPEIAGVALEQLSERTRLSGSEWALGVEARSRALLSDGERAEELYVEAIERLGRCRIKVHVPRAQLIYGEWLRRENRRTDARLPLRAAHEAFATMGAEAFAARAARELLATGEHARKRTDDTRGQLTAQETHIARLAREGRSNPEIAAQLFISPRTVEYHLHKVFAKLAISSRNELDRVLSGEVREAQPV